MGHIKPLSG